MKARVVLRFGNQGPIGRTFIHLLARTTVNRNSLNSDILKALSHFNDVFGVVVPAQTGLNRHRLIYGFDNLRGHLHHLWNVLQDTGTGTFTCYILHRTAVIDINDVRIRRGTNLGSLSHALNLVPKNLNT